MNVKYRSIRKSTANRVMSDFLQMSHGRPPVNGGATFMHGSERFEFFDNQWHRAIPVRDKLPPIHACVVYGEFTVPETGDGHFAIRYPTSVPWRKIVPQIRAVVRTLGGKRGGYLNVDGISDTYEGAAVFARLKGTRRYNWVNGQFKLLAKGRPRAPKTSQTADATDG